jgi:glycosyltransferase involved in cell wall biosynthesis
VADQVWLAGPRDDVASLIRAMDVFVLPSLNEGISNTILEAMGTGRPVIAARVGGNGELVQSGVTGVLYDPGDEAALTGALVRYCEQPQLCAAHGAAGRRRVVERFSLDAMVGQYVALYQRLIAR